MGEKKPASGTVKASGAKQDRAKAAAAANPVQVGDVQRPPKAAKAASASVPAQRPPFARSASFNFAGVGRNDICPCGSGKRFKNCHGH